MRGVAGACGVRASNSIARTLLGITRNGTGADVSFVCAKTDGDNATVAAHKTRDVGSRVVFIRVLLK